MAKTIDAELCFCPEHAKIAEWAEEQCPGCVGVWGDCDLWRAFAYAGRRSLTDADLETSRRGRCPKRTNGTMVVRGGKIEEINHSEVATTESGEALVKAIKDYWVKYS